MENKVFDVVVIGSGLGGLVCANILAKEGHSVCVLEKNRQFGGNLQTFVRDKTIFDTGVHYIGGLSKGQNLYKYFKYLEVIQSLELQQLNEDGYDIITFDGDPNEYKHAQGYDNFIKTLLKSFPSEKEAIDTYCQKLKDTCNKFPLYKLGCGPIDFADAELFSLNAKDYIDGLTKNEKLKAVLAGSNLLYAGDGTKSPFYVHALSVNSYIESAYRCKNGGSQITKILLRKLKERGGEAYKHSEVVNFNYNDKQIDSVVLKNGKQVQAKTVISNVDPKKTLQLAGVDHFRKPYVKRINNLENVISTFSIYIVLKPKSFRYLNQNYYHFKYSTRVWQVQDYTEESWPEAYMISMGAKKNQSEWGEGLTAMTYMKYSEVEKWADSFNTVSNESDRGRSYEDFKKRKTDKLIDEIEKKFPNIRACIHEVYSSTPLSYRDYIGNTNGSAYGFVKDVTSPLKSFVSPKTKIPNLLLTGQSLNMHGILGVTISAIITCSYILGQDYILDQVHRANMEH